MDGDTSILDELKTTILDVLIDDCRIKAYKHAATYI
jgi:hypothetical protein